MSSIRSLVKECVLNVLKENLSNPTPDLSEKKENDMYGDMLRAQKAAAKNKDAEQYIYYTQALRNQGSAYAGWDKFKGTWAYEQWKKSLGNVIQAVQKEMDKFMFGNPGQAVPESTIKEVNHTTNDLGASVIAVGAPNSLARAKIEHPNAIQQIVSVLTKRFGPLSQHGTSKHEKLRITIHSAAELLASRAFGMEKWLIPLITQAVEDAYWGNELTEDSNEPPQEPSEDAFYVEYHSERTDEVPFQLQGNKFEYVNGKYPDGKVDIAVYAFAGDMVYGYKAFRKMMRLDIYPSSDKSPSAISKEAFDPTSVGPNPAASEGETVYDPYTSMNDQMRQMEEVDSDILHDVGYYLQNSGLTHEEQFIVDLKSQNYNSSDIAREFTKRFRIRHVIDGNYMNALYNSALRKLRAKAEKEDKYPFVKENSTCEGNAKWEAEGRCGQCGTPNGKCNCKILKRVQAYIALKKQISQMEAENPSSPELKDLIAQKEKEEPWVKDILQQAGYGHQSRPYLREENNTTVQNINQQFNAEIDGLKKLFPKLSFGYIGNLTNDPKIGDNGDDRSWYVWNGRLKWGGFPTRELPTMWQQWQSTRDKILGIWCPQCNIPIRQEKIPKGVSKYCTACSTDWSMKENMGRYAQLAGATDLKETEDMAGRDVTGLSGEGSIVPNPGNPEMKRINALVDKDKVCDHPSGFAYSGTTPKTGVPTCHLCGATKPEKRKQVPRLGQFQENKLATEEVNEFLAKFGLGPKYKKSKRKTYPCPDCKGSNAYYVENHPDCDGGMNEMVLECPDCSSCKKKKFK